MSAFIAKGIENATPYFRAFCTAKGIKNGDEWKSWEYMGWITKKHIEYRKENGLHEHWVPESDKHKREFKAWLFEQAAHEGRGQANDANDNSDSAGAVDGSVAGADGTKHTDIQHEDIIITLRELERGCPCPARLGTGS